MQDLLRRCCCLLAAVLTLGTLAAHAQPAPARSVQDELVRMLAGAQPPFLQQQAAVAERNLLRSAYQQHGDAPFWVNAQGALSPQALVLLQAMRSAEERALDPDDYEAATILGEAAAAQGADAARYAQLDIAISIAAIRFATHLHFGRIDPKAAGFDMPARSPIDLGEALAKLATTADTQAVLASLEPQFHHYRLLRAALVTYRQLAMQPQLTQLPALPAKSVKPGEPYAAAAQLRILLRAVGDLSVAAAATDANATLDAQLAQGLKRFQFRHGLRQDGALGRETYAALTTPLSQRVRQIELTLERWRWLPALDVPTIIVNIPQFRLFAFPSDDSEAQMLTMDVIVGKTFPRTRTPVFAGDLKYVKFRPYWDVPYSIMTTEMLPQIRVDPTYLAKHDLEIVGSQDDRATPLPATPDNIAALAAGKLRVRQRPGPANSLGLVKFMLPNKYNVYLHSTPARALFNEPRRAFSHGCIRVSDPVALAEYVLRNVPGAWTREKIAAALDGTDNLRVDLKQWIRVLIVYGTAVATEAGNVYFFEDLYGNDARLAQLLGKAGKS